MLVSDNLMLLWFNLFSASLGIFKNMALSASRWGVQLLPKVRPRKAANIDWNIGKYPNQLDCIQADAPNWERRLAKLDYTSQENFKLGMLDHDQLVENDPVIKEARKRMSPEETQAWYFRVSRAQIMSANHQILPEDQWTPMDADHNYLQQHIHVVTCEMKERKLMKCALSDYEDVYDRLMLTGFRFKNYFAIQALRKKLRAHLVAPHLL